MNNTALKTLGLFLMFNLISCGSGDGALNQQNSENIVPTEVGIENNFDLYGFKRDGTYVDMRRILGQDDIRIINNLNCDLNNYP